MEYPEVDGDAHLSYFGLEINFLGNFGPEDLYLILFTMVCNNPKQNVCKKCWFNPIQDGLFRDCSRLGGSQKGGGAGLPKICHTYPTMMKLGSNIPYPKKIQSTYESRDTPLEFCWHQPFFNGNHQILLYQEIHI